MGKQVTREISRKKDLPLRLLYFSTPAPTAGKFCTPLSTSRSTRQHTPERGSRLWSANTAARLWNIPRYPGLIHSLQGFLISPSSLSSRFWARKDDFRSSIHLNTKCCRNMLSFPWWELSGPILPVPSTSVPCLALSRGKVNSKRRLSDTGVTHSILEKGVERSWVLSVSKGSKGRNL